VKLGSDLGEEYWWRIFKKEVMRKLLEISEDKKIYKKDKHFK